jgi:hypothetical protein
MLFLPYPSGKCLIDTWILEFRSETDKERYHTFNNEQKIITIIIQIVSLSASVYF